MRAEPGSEQPDSSQQDARQSTRTWRACSPGWRCGSRPPLRRDLGAEPLRLGLRVEHVRPNAHAWAFAELKAPGSTATDAGPGSDRRLEQWLREGRATLDDAVTPAPYPVPLYSDAESRTVITKYWVPDRDDRSKHQGCRVQDPDGPCSPRVTRCQLLMPDELDPSE